MENIELNRRAIAYLEQWDPFGYGCGSYETEAADTVAALQTIRDVKILAQKIQEIYEFSFEQWIPLQSCEEIATELIRIRHQTSCEL
jgi:hypothetical protein